MPALLAWLLGALESSIGSIIVSLLLSLGLSIASYTFAVAPIKQAIENNLSGSGAYFLNILGWLHVDMACTMVLSAYAARWAVSTSISIIRTKK